MDKRFKPIGGMFQGVRGSTSVGGSVKYAGKLLKLDKNGKIDDSCLSESVQEASHVAEELEEEKRVRAEADTSISERQEQYETSTDGRISALDSAIAAVEDSVSNLDNKEADDVSGIQADISVLENRTTAVEQASQTHAGQIAVLQTAVSGIDGAVTAIGGRVSALERSVNGDGTPNSGLLADVSKLNSSFSELNASIMTLSANLDTWVNALTVLQSDITDVKSDLSSYKSSTNTRLQEIDSAISSLDSKVDEIYDRLVNNV